MTQTLGLVLFLLRAVLLLLIGLVLSLFSLLGVLIPLSFIRELPDRLLLGVFVRVVGFSSITTNASSE
jgi:hypothetical protein